MEPARRAARQQDILQLSGYCDCYRFFDLITREGLLDRVEIAVA